MLTAEQIEDAARRLDRAERDRTPIPQLSLQYPEMTIEDAYEVQRVWTEMKLASGRTLRGRKIGLTSRAMQQAAIQESLIGRGRPRSRAWAWISPQIVAARKLPGRTTTLAKKA